MLLFKDTSMVFTFFFLVSLFFIVKVDATYESHSDKSPYIFDFTIKRKKVLYNNDNEKIILSINNSNDTYGPTIKVKPNDEVRIRVTNLICNEQELAKGANGKSKIWQDYCQASLHFHGLINIGNKVDGVPNLTQKPIENGESYWYNFTIPEDTCGTFWYHSHSSVQYGDGVRGLIIVNCVEYDTLKNNIINHLEIFGTSTLQSKSLLFADKNVLSSTTFIPKKFDDVTKEHNILLSDWYHERTIDILEKDVLVDDGTNDPRFESSLINGVVENNVQMKILESNTKYLILRLLNSGTSGTQVFHIPNKKLIIFETDGTLLNPYVTDTLTMAVGQRYSVLIKIEDEDKNEGFPIVKGINGCNKMMGYVTKTFWFTPIENESTITQNVETYIQENQSNNIRISKLPNFNNDELYKEYDNAKDGEIWKSNNDHSLKRIELFYDNYKAENTYKVNDKTFEEYLESPIIIDNSNNTILEIILNSKDHMRHPWHLHGFNFQIVSMGKGTLYKSAIVNHRTDIDSVKQYFQDLKYWETSRKSPLIRDSINIKGHSFVVLRVNLTNLTKKQLGKWLLHCHVEWHVSKGLGAVFQITNTSTATPNNGSNNKPISIDTMTTKIKVLTIYCILICLINYYIYIKFI
ncbi:hypothetical protein TPHA_0B04730 [Tetrapisispora phaffii CBS 4417]|uniref:Multicopper oxidase n=1 Tax=Tetrapisispora phaffii (strain ATCC 24235 / CBS 4417 / NBRC 1672 / NRRL Y-8282 / UCD 70-5) TaxID=1071381 RepID=G8BQ61_TETPH|nr:hypothetical protein TPHA_0B04730 [Tetrapisispora phaffii CBS 4417]CCE62142.1 hypothetical protein TPHA_0B04730 [Tetrapisispora phaffii CBS 4417]